MTWVFIRDGAESAKIYALGATIRVTRTELSFYVLVDVPVFGQVFADHLPKAFVAQLAAWTQEAAP